MKDEIVTKCREIIPCDTARITAPMERLFLVIGFNRNTKQDTEQWFKNGEKIDFDYVQESVVASGDNENELIESAKEYQRLSKMTWEDYFKGLIDQPKN